VTIFEFTALLQTAPPDIYFSNCEVVVLPIGNLPHGIIGKLLL